MSARRIAVLGAGAAGTVAAIFAARAGADVLLLERTRDGGRKILISGGGRCNVLPTRVDESRFITQSSPNTMRKLLRSWPHAEQRAFFEREVGLPLVEETASGKLFPASDRARDVRDGLLALAARSGARFIPETRVTGLAPAPAGGWHIECEGRAPLVVDRVVVATGGLSVPNTGSDGTGLRLLERLGHVLHPPYAALTPLTTDAPPFGGLAGLSLTCTVTARAEPGARQGPDAEARATGGFLFTHRGYSGPAVLDVSHVAVRARQFGHGATVTVQWTADDADAWDAVLRPEGTRTVGGVVRRALPERLADALIAASALEPQRPLAQLRREERRRLVDALTRCPLPWSGDESYRKAEVTGGGVALSDVDPRTLESRRTPGLHLASEVLDVFGPIGGYNFYWAWATGRLAGLGAAGSGPPPSRGG